MAATSVRRGATRTARALEHALFAVAFASIGYWVVEAGLRSWHFAKQEQRLLGLIRSKPGAEARGGRSGLVGRLEIPRLGMAVIVEEGVEEATLRRAAGHLPGTALPGEEGNVVVAGHRDTLFRPLRDVRTGDLIRFVTPDGVFEYEVTAAQVVEATQVEVLEPRAAREITLVTCYPFGFVGPAPQRYVVRAERAVSASRPVRRPPFLQRNAWAASLR
jgi:sortase A